MVTVMPPCGLPGFGGGATSQPHLSRYLYHAVEADPGPDQPENTRSYGNNTYANNGGKVVFNQAAVMPENRPNSGLGPAHYPPIQGNGNGHINENFQPGQHVSRGKTIFNSSYGYPVSQGANSRSMQSRGKQMDPQIPDGSRGVATQQVFKGKDIYNSLLDPKEVATPEAPVEVRQRASSVRSRGKNLMNYASAVKGFDGPERPASDTGKTQESFAIAYDNSASFVKCGGGGNYTASASASSAAASSSSGIIVPAVQAPLEQQELEDVSCGDGGPPKVRGSNHSPQIAKPIFVDCSVEYELPKMTKVPSDSLPLLMVNPDWQAKKPVTRSTSHQVALLPPFQMVNQHVGNTFANHGNLGAASSQSAMGGSGSGAGRKRNYPAQAAAAAAAYTPMDHMKQLPSHTGNGNLSHVAPPTSRQIPHQQGHNQHENSKRARVSAPTFDNWIIHTRQATSGGSVTVNGTSNVFQPSPESLFKMSCGCLVPLATVHANQMGNIQSAIGHPQNPAVSQTGFQPHHHQHQHHFHHEAIWGGQLNSQCPPPLPAPPIQQAGSVWNQQPSTSSSTTHHGRLLRSHAQLSYSMPQNSMGSSGTATTWMTQHQQNMFLQQQQQQHQREQQRQHWLLQQRIHLQQQQQQQQQRFQLQQQQACPKCPDCHYIQSQMPPVLNNSTTSVRYRSV